MGSVFDVLEQCWSVGVPPKLFEMHQKYGHKKELARLVLVREVLEEDTREIYEGRKRQGMDDCFVYSGRPSRDFRSVTLGSTIETPAPTDMEFLVFVLPSGSIDHWRWQPTDEGRPKETKGKLIWPLNRS